ncbi:MAG TPA: ribulose-phosphate 3-epimerase [Terriglobia bacterium]|nr:ribulose-phosphate 3-epimerase [Terriglobia bacterium]
MVWIAPALLSANFARLGEALEIAKSAGATMVHIDVTDGHFTPDVSVGQPVLARLRQATDLVLDVRLAIERPERFADDFLKAGADRVSIHVESTRHWHSTLESVRARRAKAGVALNPETPVDLIEDALGDLDFLTILSADLGADGRFIPWAAAKVRQAARLREDRRLGFAIQVEGGIGLESVEELIRSGADILVAGSAIFHSENPKARLQEMIRLASEVRQTSRA